MKSLFLLLGPVAAGLVGIGAAAWGQTPEVAWTAAVGTLCAVWWISEAIPMAVTGIVPIAVLPMVGVLTTSQVGQAYGSPLILLLLGGFMLSTAMEHSGAHRRLALGMVRLVGGGGGGRRLVFGFMVASTTLMLLPIALAVLERSDDPRLRQALLLSVAYAASIGGIGTPIGTPPNLVFMQVYKEQFGVEPTFVQWMQWSLPVALVMLPLAALWLTRGLKRGESLQLPEVGAWRPQEVRTLAVFGVTALLWVTRNEPWGGWSEYLKLEGANDASVALLAVLAMFLIPSGSRDEEGRPIRLLNWEVVNRIPWNILLLYSGGMVLAKGFAESGLSTLIGDALSGLGALPVYLIVAIICLMVTFLTEVTSNVATTTLLMPVLAALAVGVGIEPRLVMVPATLSASFAFMLPVATAPNAIVYGAGGVSPGGMAREGLALNLLGVIVVTVLSGMLMR